MNTRFAVPVLFFSSAGWGLTWLPIKALSEQGLDGLHLVFIAFCSGALLLLPWLYRQRQLWRHKLSLMALVALAGGFANASFQTAIYHGDVIRVMILFYMLPVWSVLGGRLFLGEHVDGVRILAVALCLSGAFIILDVAHTSWSGISWIDALALGSGMGLAATNILFRFTRDIPVMSKVAAMFIGCAAMIGISSLFVASTGSLPTATAALWAAAYGGLWLTLITTGTQWGVTQMDAGRSAIIIVAELVVAVASTAIIMSADLQWYEVLGGVMVLVAAILEGSRSEQPAPATLPAQAR
jgi:drug/metabolite transporter (DMT)-like permease|tara:strand:+ start:36886 stop:37776 length:891 start_codon:yes stop_codon:yes gene_type:complete